MNQHYTTCCDFNPLSVLRIVRVYRGKKNFGFTLRGHAPVCLDSVIAGTAPMLKPRTMWHLIDASSLCVAGGSSHCSVLAGEGGGGAGAF